MVCTRNAGGTLSMYVNGQLINSTTRAVNVSNSTDIFIGMNNITFANRYFSGVIDELRVWNASLSHEEIQQQYLSNLNKLNSTQWYFYANQTRNATDTLTNGTYTFNVYTQNQNTSYASTGDRIYVVDGADPNVTLNLPLGNYSNTTANPATVVFNCSATDNNTLTNITLYITASDNTSFAADQTATVNGSNASAQWNKSVSNGDYTWNCLATDTAGNSAFASANRSFSVDYTAPAEETTTTTTTTTSGRNSDSSRRVRTDTITNYLTDGVSQFTLIEDNSVIFTTDGTEHKITATETNTDEATVVVNGKSYTMEEETTIDFGAFTLSAVDLRTASVVLIVQLPQEDDVEEIMEETDDMEDDESDMDGDIDTETIEDEQQDEEGSSLASKALATLVLLGGIWYLYSEAIIRFLI